MKLLLFCLVPLFLSLLADDCLKGGPKVEANKYPFTAKLWIHRPPHGGLCTGSLVKKNLILTAKHCFVKDGQTYKDGTASFYYSSSKCTQAKKMEIGMKLVKTYRDSDLALARLTRKIKGIMPAKINRKKFKIGTSMRIVGYGMHDHRQDDGHLRHIILKTSFDNGTKIGTKLGPDNAGPCAGDSGGPLLVKADGFWSIVATLQGYGYDCRNNTISSKYPDDVWSSVRVIKKHDLRRCMKSESC